MLRLRCALSGLWGFTSTVRPAFDNLTNYSYATVVVREAGPCQNRAFPLDRRRYYGCLYEAKVLNVLYTLGGIQQGLLLPVGLVERYVYSRYMRCSRLVFTEYFRQVLQAGRSVLCLPGAVAEWLMHVCYIVMCVPLSRTVGYCSAWPSY